MAPDPLHGGLCSVPGRSIPDFHQGGYGLKSMLGFTLNHLPTIVLSTLSNSIDLSIPLKCNTMLTCTVAVSLL